MSLIFQKSATEIYGARMARDKSKDSWVSAWINEEYLPLTFLQTDRDAHNVAQWIRKFVAVEKYSNFTFCFRSSADSKKILRRRQCQATARTRFSLNTDSDVGSYVLVYRWWINLLLSLFAFWIRFASSFGCCAVAALFSLRMRLLNSHFDTFYGRNILLSSSG